MATRDDTIDITVQTKISSADSKRLDAEVERQSSAHPGGEYTRSSVVRGWLLAALDEAETTAKKSKRAS